MGSWLQGQGFIACFLVWVWAVALYVCAMLAAVAQAVQSLSLAPFSHTPHLLLTPDHGGFGVGQRSTKWIATTNLGFVSGP